MSFSIAYRNVSKIQIALVFVITISVAVGSLIGMLNEVGLFVFFALLLTTAFFLVLWRPIWLFYLVFVVSSSASAFREVNLPFGNTTLTLSGFLWLSITALIVFFLLMHIKEVQVFGYLWPFIFFSLWMIIRWIITPTGFAGLKDIVWYSMPVVFGLFVPVALGRNRRVFLHNVERVEKAFLFSALIPVVLYGVALSTGLAEMTSQGPRGELIGSARGTPLYLLTVLSLALGNWRYDPKRIRGRIFSLISLGTVFFTLGRMVIFLGLLQLGLSSVNLRQKWKVLFAASVTMAFFFYAVMHFPLLQQRFFFTDAWDPSMGLRGVNTAGRNVIWPTVFSSALHEPMIGRGIGTARVVTAQLFVDKNVSEYHPHNEYLQVFHDAGLLGLLLVCYAWITLFIRQWKLWERAELKEVQKWGMASTLSVAMVLISALTDNTWHYSIVIAPTFVLVTIATLMQRMDLNAEDN